MAFDPYKQLGVERGATQKEIKRAWRSLAQKIHPDKNPDDPHAATRFELAKEAFEILSDPARRARYDDGGETKKSDLRERAIACLLTAFHAELELGLQSGAFRPGAIFPIIESTDARLAMQLRDFGIARADFAKNETALKRVLKRFKKGGESQNLLADSILHQLDKVAEKIARCDLAEEEVLEARHMLQEYDDLPDDADAIRTLRLPHTPDSVISDVVRILT